jgi:hypothetical protein
MKSSAILKASKNNTFTKMNSFIINSGLELELIQSTPFTNMWLVKNNKEFSHITNTIKYLGQDISEVTFAWL